MKKKNESLMKIFKNKFVELSIIEFFSFLSVHLCLSPPFLSLFSLYSPSYCDFISLYRSPQPITMPCHVCIYTYFFLFISPHKKLDSLGIQSPSAHCADWGKGRHLLHQFFLQSLPATTLGDLTDSTSISTQVLCVPSFGGWPNPPSSPVCLKWATMKS